MLDQLIAERRKKLEQYRKVREAYPGEARQRLPISEVVSNFKKLLKKKTKVKIVGRIVSLRDQGKIAFWELADQSGRIQTVLSAQKIKDFSFIAQTFDLGDFAEIEGTLIVTKRGTESLEAKKVTMLSKSLRPLPSEWFGLADEEAKLRKRYLDILLNPEVKKLFIQKAKFWSAIRKSLEEAGFLEVQTPVLENIPGGAEAEPFVTHHNALDTDFYLRISLELPLKKLLVAGYDKVFEIGRIFRNEGIDREHLQDYTQMECYWAYADYKAMMKFTREMYLRAIKEAFGTLKLKTADGTVINWGAKWPEVDYETEFKKGTGLVLAKATNAELLAKTKELKLEIPKNAGRARLIDVLFKKTCRPKLIQPCFLINPPVDIEPLAKRLPNDARRVARFQIVAMGSELGKGFSELNDPLDQRARFEEQEKARAAGDAEAQRIDEDFLEAMEYGMPPAAGFGMSERLFAFFADKSVREASIFPLTRPESEN
jgi:lysyl-tRNA synthetase class 2